jgi:hypothetical protein
MKHLYFFSILAVLSTPVFAIENNSLQGACGFVALTSEHIKGLNSWGHTKEICIGVGESQSLAHVKNSGEFEKDSKEFVADRPFYHHTRIEVSELPSKF